MVKILDFNCVRNFFFYFYLIYLFPIRLFIISFYFNLHDVHYLNSPKCSVCYCLANKARIFVVENTNAKPLCFSSTIFLSMVTLQQPL